MTEWEGEKIREMVLGINLFDLSIHVEGDDQVNGERREIESEEL